MPHGQKLGLSYSKHNKEVEATTLGTLQKVFQSIQQERMSRQ